MKCTCFNLFTSIVILFCLISLPTMAQQKELIQEIQQLEILSPADMDTVITSQLLVVVQLPQNHKQLYSKFMVVLDESLDLSELIKIKGNFLSVLHDEKMKRGMHQLKVLVKRKGSSEYEVVHNHFFKVLPALKENKWVSKRQMKQTGTKSYPLKVAGNIQLLSNDVKLTGPGAIIRQEPSFTREVGLNLNLKINKIEIPVSAFLTTNSRGNYGYRNRFNIGVKRGRLAASIGDHFVDENRLIFSGIRINGFSITAPVGRESNFTSVIGRNVDELFTDNNFPLSTIESTNLFNEGLARYRRNFQYFELSSYYNKELNYTSISLLKAYDLYGEQLINGLKPKDNLVFGFENFYSMFQKKSTLRINIALSMLTNDKSIPTEMKEYEQFININASSTPTTLKGVESLGAIVNYQLKFAPKHSISLEGRRLGASYYSLGNPYLLNNRLSFRASERSTFVKNKLFLNFTYDYMHDNMNKIAAITRENNILSSSFLLNINKKIPVLTIGFRTFLGNSYGFTNIANNKITSNNLFGNLQYSIKLKSFTPQVSISRNDMQMITYLSTDNKQQVNDISLGLTYKQKVGIELQGTQVTQQVNELVLPQKMLSGRLWYLIKKPAIKLNLRVNSNEIRIENQGKEKRFSTLFGIDYYPIKKIMINVSAGTSPYTSYNSIYNYNEQFVQVRANLFL
jgi:hypothetical protein